MKTLLRLPFGLRFIRAKPIEEVIAELVVACGDKQEGETENTFTVRMHCGAALVFDNKPVPVKVVVRLKNILDALVDKNRR